ncbi:MAG: hypothetical protein GY874_08865 [Desulfobacteraceae bacterium]|nr:hypothetical protein [Desulfobacteraceae bacterium]
MNKQTIHRLQAGTIKPRTSLRQEHRHGKAGGPGPRAVKNLFRVLEAVKVVLLRRIWLRFQGASMGAYSTSLPIGAIRKPDSKGHMIKTSNSGIFAIYKPLRALCTVAVLVVSANVWQPSQVFAKAADAPLPNPIVQAEQAFKNQAYGDAIKLLNKAAFQTGADSRQRLDALYALATLYHDAVGDFKRALRLLHQVRSDSPATSGIHQRAEAKIEQIANDAVRFSQQNKLIDALKRHSGRTGSTQAQYSRIKLLQGLIETTPDYSGLHEVLYYLGLEYAGLEKYHKAIGAFNRAKKLKPAINFYLPVDVNLKKVTAQRDLILFQVGIKICTGLLLLITMVVFYQAKPWRNFSWKQIAISSGAILSWLLLFCLATLVLTPDTVPIEASSIEIKEFPQPLFVKGAAANTGIELMRNFFLYTLICMIGIMLFCAGISRMPVKTRALTLSFLSCVYSLFLIAAMLSLFYYYHLSDATCVFRSSRDNFFKYVDGRFYLLYEDPEPCLLTAPLEYPGLEMDNIPDPYLKKWLEQYQ